MSVLRRLGLGSSAEIASLRADVDDLGRAHHHTATTMEELRARLAKLREVLDPVRSRAVREAVDSMLPLVAAAVADADVARTDLQEVKRELRAARARLEALELSLAALQAHLAKELAG